jgi:hypothetical protein
VALRQSIREKRIQVNGIHIRENDGRPLAKLLNETALRNQSGLPPWSSEVNNVPRLRSAGFGWVVTGA